MSSFTVASVEVRTEKAECEGELDSPGAGAVASSCSSPQCLYPHHHARKETQLSWAKEAAPQPHHPGGAEIRSEGVQNQVSKHRRAEPHQHPTAAAAVKGTSEGRVND